jgi:hypothetical protein
MNGIKIKGAIQEDGLMGFTHHTTQASMDAANAVLGLVGAEPITPAALAQAFPGAVIGATRERQFAPLSNASERIRALLDGNERIPGMNPAFGFPYGGRIHQEFTHQPPAFVGVDTPDLVSFDKSLVKAHENKVRNVLADLSYEDWVLHVGVRAGMVYISAKFIAPCSKTGNIETHQTRRWLIRPDAEEMEIVQTAFKCIITALEHEAREKFAYRGRAILGPHQSLAVLWANAEEVGYAN